MIFDRSPQGSDAWIECRRGCITGSRFRDARDRLKSGAPSKECLAYAMDLARERCGGRAPGAFVNAAMRTGTEQEPIARMAYELATDSLVEEVGFACTEDRKFGLSVDGLVRPKGGVEIKCLVSSNTLFKAMVDGDISDYRDQCNGAMWLLGLEWMDLVLWAPDLPESARLTVIRIERDDDEIERLEADLIAFDQLVSSYEAKLRARITGSFAEPPPWESIAATAKPAAAPAALPASIFG